MRSVAALTVALATVAVAQSTTDSKVYSVTDLGAGLANISASLKQTWCRGQTNVCNDLCSKSFDTNNCNVDTLDYTCTCSDGKTPPLEDYVASLPTYICQTVYANCIEAHPNDLTGQDECTAARDASCNPKTLKDSAKENTTNTDSASPSATGDSSKTTEGSSAATSADATGGSQTTAAGNFAAPTAAPAAGAAAVAVAMLAYLV